MTYITILSYNTGEVFIHCINHTLEDTIDDYEEYLTKELGYRLNEISYMISDTLNLKIC